VSVSLIIPTRNQHQILDQALQSIAKSNLESVGSVEIIVVDNQSDESESQQYLAQLNSNPSLNAACDISVMSFNEPFNYSRMNNLAANRANGEVLCFLNNDVEVISDDWLVDLVQSAEQTTVGCSGALLFYPNNTVQHAGVVMGMGTIAGHAYVGLARETTHSHPYFQTARNCTAVTGACLAVSRKHFNQVEGFDETLPVAFNDVDFCLKVQELGAINRFLPHVQLYHHESLSRGKGIKTEAVKKRHERDIQMLKIRWGKALKEDSFWQSVKTDHEFSSMPQHPVAAWRTLGRRSTRYLHKDLS